MDTTLFAALIAASVSLIVATVSLVLNRLGQTHQMKQAKLEEFYEIMKGMCNQMQDLSMKKPAQQKLLELKETTKNMERLQLYMELYFKDLESDFQQLCKAQMHASLNFARTLEWAKTSKFSVDEYFNSKQFKDECYGPAYDDIFKAVKKIQLRILNDSATLTRDPWRLIIRILGQGSDLRKNRLEI